jgi:2-pyrone-4,6-dicarboxylate lactonase
MSTMISKGEIPDAGHLFELFEAWTPDRAIGRRFLVTNPTKLHYFLKLPS